jgi:uncharacterized protein (TIGR02001 family)
MIFADSAVEAARAALGRRADRSRRGARASMKTYTTAVLAAALAAATLCTSPALAGGSVKDAPEPVKREWQFSFNIGATTDYVFRGFSQSGQDPVVQGGIDVTYKWFYMGAWGSGIDFGKNVGRAGGQVNVAPVEVDLYAGFKPELWGVTFDVGVIYYSYPKAFDGRGAANRELDYVEFKLGASRELWKGGTLTSTLFLSPEYTNDTGFVWTSETGFSQALPPIRDGFGASVSALLGYQSGDDRRWRALIGNGDDDYYYWNAGITLTFAEKLSLDMRYWDTNVSNAGGFCTGNLFQCDERFVATLKFTY